MNRVQVLRFATRQQIESIFAENQPLWGAPLSYEQYRDYWYSLFLTPWGASNFRYMALTEEEDGPLLSSLKLYRLTGRLHGREIVIAGLGAIYTPEAARGLGSASLLVSEALDYMQKKRAGLALLHTEIGLPFYERLGFHPLQATETIGELPSLPPRPPSPPGGLELREAAPADARLLVPYHREVNSRAPLAIDRDASYWEFLLYRRRRYWELTPAASGRALSALALDRGQVAAAGFATVREETMRIDEIGALEGRDDALGALLDRLLALGGAAGARRWSGRLPPGIEDRDTRLRGEARPAATDLPMAAPLGSTTDREVLSVESSSWLSGLDAF
jgi:GNAT superfamily N-acetyltransferase